MYVSLCSNVLQGEQPANLPACGGRVLPTRPRCNLSSCSTYAIELRSAGLHILRTGQSRMENGGDRIRPFLVDDVRIQSVKQVTAC